MKFRGPCIFDTVDAATGPIEDIAVGRDAADAGEVGPVPGGEIVAPASGVLDVALVAPERFVFILGTTKDKAEVFGFGVPPAGAGYARDLVRDGDGGGVCVEVVTGPEAGCGVDGAEVVVCLG